MSVFCFVNTKITMKDYDFSLCDIINITKDIFLIALIFFIRLYVVIVQ